MNTKNYIVPLTISIIAALFYAASSLTPALWPGTILAFTLFYINLSQTKSILNKKQRILLQMAICFIFFLTIRMTLLWGGFTAIDALYTNSLKALIIYFTYITLTTLHFMVLAQIYEMITTKCIRPASRAILFAVCIFFLNTIDLSYFPESFEIFLYNNPNLLASVKILGQPLIQLLFFASSFLLGEIITVKEKRNITFTLFILTCTIPFMSGALVIKSFKEKKGFKNLNVALVQTNQSVYHNNADINLLALAKDLNSKKISNNEVTDVIFPEYSFVLTPENTQKIKDFQKALSFPSRIHMGVSILTDMGIRNVIHTYDINGVIINTYEKNELFPIGEKSISLPFIPKNWTRSVTPVLFKNSIEIFNVEKDVIFMPMICYEGAISSQYQKRMELLKKHEYKSALFINFSKDSFLEKTLLLDQFSLFARVQAVKYDKYSIRISSNSYSEIISPTGQILARLPKDKMVTTMVTVPLYEEN